jgi:hypothetical protein
MKENGFPTRTSDRVREDRFGLMEVCMRVGGRTTRPTEEAD